MMATLILVSLILAYVLYKWVTIKPSNYPPGPPALPFVGSLPFFKSQNIQFFLEQLREKYGPVVGAVFGSKKAVFIVGSKEVFEVLKREEFQGRPSFDGRGLLFEGGIMFSEGQYWTENRRFALKHLRDLGYGKSVMESNIIQEIDNFFEECFGKKNQIVQVGGLFNPSVVNVIYSLIGGKLFRRDDPTFQKLFFYLDRQFRSINVTGGILSALPWLRHIFPKWTGYADEVEINNYFVKFYEASIKEHQETRNPQENRDLIDYYLSDISKPNSVFNNQSILATAHNFFSAGGESTGNTLGFCLLYCVLYPELQAEIYEEVKAVLGDNYVALQDKPKFRKVEAFISEVIRCNPIAPLTVPHETMKNTTLNGYDIPNRTMVLISLYAVFQDKKYWGDPEVFRPSRFLDKEGNYIKYDYFIPFGVGKRFCIGDNIARTMLFLFLVRMVQNFEFKVPAGHPKPTTVPLTGATAAPTPFEVEVIRRLK